MLEVLTDYMFVKVNAVFKMDFAGALKKLHMVPKHDILKGHLNDISKGVLCQNQVRTHS